MDCTFFTSANAVHEAPVIEDGKIVIGRVMNLNFVVDHRYIDGARAKNFTNIFTSIFNHP
jgi:pyruvate/2-oxoglutarate dehydrogenase complex dihydrolipoamide acyltransferase (E2) component